MRNDKIQKVIQIDEKFLEEDFDLWSRQLLLEFIKFITLNHQEEYLKLRRSFENWRRGN